MSHYKKYSPQSYILHIKLVIVAFYLWCQVIYNASSERTHWSVVKVEELLQDMHKHRLILSLDGL